MKINLVVVLVLVYAFVINGFSAQESPFLYRGLRPLTMGNAFVAVADDHNSLFYNPAGLNDVEQVRVEILPITLEASLGIINILKTALDLNKDSSVDAIGNAFDEHIGEYYTLRAAITPGFTIHNFSLKLITEGRTFTAVRDQIVPHVEFGARIDNSVAFAGAYGFWDKALQVGVGFKPIYAFSTDERDLGFFNLETFKDDLKNVFTPEFGLYSDIGFKSHLEVLANTYEIPYLTPAFNYMRPRWGLTFQEIPLKGFKSIDEPPFTISTGGAASFDFWKFKNTFALDIRDINWAGNPLNKLHLGVESTWDLSKLFKPGGRIGLSQGRPTVGLSCDLLRIWRGELGVYYEETGDYERVDGDFRIAIQLTLLGWN